MKKVLILIALLTVSIGNITSAVTWDVNMDMDASANDPNGIWTYGYAEFDDPNDSNTVVYKGLLEDAGPSGGTNALWWWNPPGVISQPHLWVGPLVGVPEGMHGMKGGMTSLGYEAPCLIRWTAPASLSAPNIAISSSFVPNNGGTVEIIIVKSLAGDPSQQTFLLDQKDVTPSSGVEFSTTCDIAAGDTIDFMVSSQGDTLDGDWTATSITISEGELTCVTYLPMDFNEDCYVNLEDFAIFAQSWLDCNDQSNPGCQ